MKIADRVSVAVAASLKHLVGSLVVALVCSALVFGVWYPYPYDELVGGRELFLLVISVDVVSGPLLTLIVFDRSKPRRELWRDIGTVVLIQLAALGYGVASVIQARPVFLAFEGNRFRVVRVPDIEFSDIARAPEDLQRLSLTGPRLIGARLAQPTEPDFLSSIQLSMRGVHPSFRPERWVDYDSQRESVAREAKPLSELRHKHPTQNPTINEAIRRTGLSEQWLGYLPLMAGRHTDWVVVVNRRDGEPKAFLPLDGW